MYDDKKSTTPSGEQAFLLVTLPHVTVRQVFEGEPMVLATGGLQ